MKNVIFLLVLLSLVSCEKKEDILTEPNANDVSRRSQILSTPNLISNSSFELNGQASLSNWHYMNGPCCLDSFSTDVPFGGGMYSLKLEPMWLPAEGAVEYYVTGLTCTSAFQLKFRAKYSGVPNYQAYASIYMKTSPLPILSIVYLTNPSWTIYTLNTISYSMLPSDTLVVKLSAGSTEVANWQVLFDKVSLEKF